MDYQFGQFTMHPEVTVTETEHDCEVKKFFPVGRQVSAWEPVREEYMPGVVTSHGLNYLEVRLSNGGHVYALANIAVKRGVVTGFDPDESLVY